MFVSVEIGNRPANSWPSTIRLLPRSTWTSGSGLPLASKNGASRDRCLIVEQDDKLVADANERDLLACDVGEIEPRVGIERQRDRLAIGRLGQLDDLRRLGRALASRHGLRDSEGRIHSVRPPSRQSYRFINTGRGA